MLKETLLLWRDQFLLIPFGKKWFPRITVGESNSEVKVTANLPGIDPRNIKLDVRDTRITLSGFTEREKKDRHPLRYEHAYAEFKREIYLPTRVNPTDAHATYRDGAVIITIPKMIEDSEPVHFKYKTI